MEYRLLGPLEVRVGDGPLPLGGAKQRALLALLLLRANRVVARERLIDALWGERPPETVVKSVQLYVSQLRKLLPEGTIVTRAPGYLLVVEPEQLDLFRFERLVAEARTAEPAVASRLLREGLELWRGPPLAEFGEEPFARTEGGRLEELRLAAVEERLEAELALGRHGELVGELEALIAEQPQRERLRGQLMLALYRSGRQAEALEAYRSARAALDEFGLEPGGRLRELEKQILTQDAVLDLGGASLLAVELVPLPGPLVPTPPFPFVGRAEELAALRTLLDRAEAGEGGLVLLAAEAGGGKTRLIRELAHEAAAGGVFVLYGASDAAVITPYQPVREWLGFLLRTCDPDALRECLGAGAGELTRLVPELERLTGLAAPERRDPESERFALQVAVSELLARLSRRQPLLVVADDVHWADSETLHLLRRLARSAPEARWLVVAAYRGEEAAGELADTLADLGRQDAVMRLALGNLSTEEVGAFIQASSDADAEATVDLVSAIGELTDGTPLLLCELWRELHESGGVEVAETVRLTRPVAELRGPERVRELVRQRLARLDPETVAMLELAAVAGPQFELRLIAAAAGVEPMTLAAALEQATASGIVEELPGPALSHRFTHELVRRAVYDRVPGIRRAELHLRVGEALEQTHAADSGRVLPELAHHFTLAAPIAGPERAVAYNLRAAEAAVESAALKEAAARLSSALAVGISDARERVRVQIELAWLLAESGQTTEARALFDEALETATRLGERGLAAEARVLTGWRDWLGPVDLLAPHGRVEERRQIAEDAIVTFTELGDVRGLALARHLLAYAYRGAGRAADACAELELALVDAETSGHAPTRSRVISQLLQMLLTGPAPVADAIRRCEELRRSATGDAVLAATIERGLAPLYAMAARDDEARECLRRAAEVLDQLDYHTQVWFRLYAAKAERLLGDWAAAEQNLVAVWRRFGGEDGGAPRLQAWAAARDLGSLYCDQGRWDEAERWLYWKVETALPTLEQAPTHIGWALWIAASARLALHRGEADEALRFARRAVEIGEQTDYSNDLAEAWQALAEVEHAGGRSAEADAAVAAALALYERKGNLAAAAQLRAKAEAGFRPASAPLSPTP
jgi:DNA-binding SARP family transcriptional activator